MFRLARMIALLPVTLLPSTGLILWHVDGRGHGIPVADDSSVFFLSTDHEVFSIDKASGRIRWTRRIGHENETTAGSRMLIAGDTVLVGDYDVFGLGRRDGHLRWHFSPTVGYGPGIYLGTVLRNFVLAGSPAGRMYAVDATTGRQRWTTAVATDDVTTVFEPLGVANEVVAGYTTFTAPATGGVVSVDAANGRLRWKTAFPSTTSAGIGRGFAGGPLVIGDVVIGASGDGSIHAFGRANGSMLWSLPAVTNQRGTSQTQDYRALAFDGQTLVAASLSGIVIAYDYPSLKERWRFSDWRYGSTTFSIGCDAGFAYVPYVSGRLVALSLTDGARQWEVGDTATQFSWAPVRAGNSLFAAASTGFFAFRR